MENNEMTDNNKPENQSEILEGKLRTGQLLATAIEQIADIRALLVVNAFLSQSLLEAIGAKSEPLMDAIEKLNLDIGDHVEASLRAKLGLPMQPESREARLQRFRNQLDIDRYDWPSIPEC